MQIIRVQNAIDNIQDFAQLVDGSTHTLVRLEPQTDTWTDHTTRMLCDHVTTLVCEKIKQHETMKIRDSIESLLRA